MTRKRDDHLKISHIAWLVAMVMLISAACFWCATGTSGSDVRVSGEMALVSY